MKHMPFAVIYQQNANTARNAQLMHENKMWRTECKAIHLVEHTSNECCIENGVTHAFCPIRSTSNWLKYSFKKNELKRKPAANKLNWINWWIGSFWTEVILKIAYSNSWGAHAQPPSLTPFYYWPLCLRLSKNWTCSFLQQVFFPPVSLQYRNEWSSLQN